MVQAVTEPVRAARRFYAEELRFGADIRSSALQAAFASVPRERFVGPGPWRIAKAFDIGSYWTTENDDPRHVYHDVLIALDESRGCNNGQPSFWAFLLDQLAVRPGETVVHLGCGTGYYTAILAELVGADGAVRAIEIDNALGGRAREALEPWLRVTVEVADAIAVPIGPTDIIVVSAGATRPLPAWLDALNAGGRLLLPMTSSGPGAMLLVRRVGAGFAARFLCSAAFVAFQGLRDAQTADRLAAALQEDRGESVRSIRRDPHEADDSCWLHGDGWCLSRRGLPST